MSREMLLMEKQNVKKLGLTELIENEMLDKKTAEYLAEKAKTSSGILFCGKGTV